MSLQDIAQVSISLNSSGVSRAGYGTPIFLTAQNFTSGLVTSYTSLASLGEVFPVGTNAYAAAASVFANNPSVDVLKIGRILGDSEITPQPTGAGGTVVTGTLYNLSIEDQDGKAISALYLTEAGDTLADVVTSLVSDINAAALDITLTNNGDTFTITPTTPRTSGGDFTLSGLVNITAPSANAEDILTAYNAILAVDNDFYVVATEDHTTLGDNATGIRGLANTIEASASSGSPKVYFLGSSALESINTAYTEGELPDSTADVIAYMNLDNNFRTITFWHQDADKEFNELTFAGYNLPFDSGSVVWGNLQLPMSSATNSQGNALTATQEQNLADRKANWASRKGNIVYSREGYVAAGEWIDTIRGRDNLQTDLEADLFDLLTNQQGQKLPYTDKGINVVAGVVETRLNDYKVNRGFLTDPITINIPKAKDISREDKVARILNDLTFNASLAGGILLTDIKGSLEV